MITMSKKELIERIEVLNCEYFTLSIEMTEPGSRWKLPDVRMSNPLLEPHPIMYAKTPREYRLDIRFKEVS